MPSPISVKIEVPAWMKKYLQYQSEDKNAKILKFARKHEYNLLLTNLVTNYRRISILKDSNTKFKNNREVKIYLPFSDKKDVYFYNYISRHSAETFRRNINLDFLYDFKLYLRNALLNGTQRKIAIENFLNMYNINEDELKFESLYRRYTRYMNKIKRIV